MHRRIYCAKCADNATKALPSEDLARGFSKRVVRVVARTPEEHSMTVNASVVKLENLICDRCDRDIPEGELVFAETVWNNNREGVPKQWEHVYGSILPDDVAKIAEDLSRE